MTDEELNEISKELFLEVIKSIEFPPNIVVEKQEDDNFLFIQKLSNKTGSAVFYFKPNLYLVKEYVKQFEILEHATDKNLNEDIIFLFYQPLIFGLLTNFHLEIEDSFNNFMDYPFSVMSQLFSIVDKELDISDDTELILQEKRKRNIEKLADRRGSNFKKRIKRLFDEVKERKKVPNRNLVSPFYYRVLPSWKEAKKFYKQNSKYQNWEKMALLAFPEFPQDLIQRLGSPDPYSSMPSSIALEYAARLCGFKDNSIELRTLQNYLRESRSWLEKQNQQEVTKEVNMFFEDVLEDVFVGISISQSLGKDVTFENYPLIHQKFYNELMDSEQGKFENNENSIMKIFTGNKVS